MQAYQVNHVNSLIDMSQDKPYLFKASSTKLPPARQPMTREQKRRYRRRSRLLASGTPSGVDLGRVFVATGHASFAG
ncbi:MAG: hypothetical protein HRU19_01515 [Pseudobacteriovorax sp.]|nr:hypothetical protein [Pseudobacteriovorax sp.]